jgi:hypothetical protein
MRNLRDMEKAALERGNSLRRGPVGEHGPGGGVRLPEILRGRLRALETGNYLRRGPVGEHGPPGGSFTGTF